MNILRRYEELKAEVRVLNRELQRKESEDEELKAEYIDQIKAADFLVAIGQEIHKEAVEKIESVVTIAISHVYDRPFSFRLIFETQRSNIEARPVIFEGKNEYDIKDDLGGGLVDIASFAMRIALWSIHSPQSRSIFILDEPFKWTGNYIDKAGAMLKYLADELNLQIILVSHDKELVAICDRVYTVSHDGKNSSTVLTKRKLKRRRKNG